MLTKDGPRREVAIHKWRHPQRGKGWSAIRWSYSISLFSKMSEKGEGGAKNLKKWVTSFLDGPEGGITTPIWKIGLIYRWQRKFNSRNTIDLSALIALKVNTFCNTMGCHPTSFSDAFSQMTSLPLLHTAQMGSNNMLKLGIWDCCSL